MWTPSEEFKKSILELGMEYNILPKAEALALKQKAYSNFAAHQRYDYPLWERLKPCDSVTREFVWRWFKDLLKNEKVYLFFENVKDDTVFYIEDGASVSLILDNAPGMTVYIVNKEVTYLYAYHDDHDILRACGDARGKVLLK